MGKQIGVVIGPQRRNHFTQATNPSALLHFSPTNAELERIKHRAVYDPYAGMDRRPPVLSLNLK